MSEPPEVPLRVVGAAIIEAGRCLVAQRGIAMSLSGQWEFPGGKVERGESAAAALARELAEELGIVVRVGAALGRSEIASPNGGLTLEVFAVERIDGEPEAREHAALRWVTAAELAELDWAAADVPHLPAVSALLGASLASR